MFEDSWVDPDHLTGQSAAGVKSRVIEDLSHHGFGHHVVVTHAIAISSLRLLEEIDPTFGPWTDCTVYENDYVRAPALAQRLVAFQRPEDAVLYRLLLP